MRRPARVGQRRTAHRQKQVSSQEESANLQAFVCILVFIERF